jgi:hypothetical protein
MTTIKSTIGGSKMLGSIVMRSTYETVEVHSRTDTGRVCVNVDFRGYYSVEQLDELIGMLEQAKVAASGERERLRHGSLFDTTNNGEIAL